MATQVRIVGKIRNTFRSDTLSKWETNNPILLDGEIGVVTGLNEVGDGLENKSQKIKIGDGIHTWKELDWFSSGGTSTLDVDQTYNPESANAQSGVALAPIFQKKLEMWQPNTEYKVGDIVIADRYFEGEESSVTCLFKCMKKHISSGFDEEIIEMFWDYIQPINSATSLRSYKNEMGEYLATQNYVNTKLGDIETALDNIIAIQNELIGGEDV